MAAQLLGRVMAKAQVTKAQGIERAALCAQMMRDGAHNRDIRAALKRELNLTIGDQILSHMRNGKYKGYGHEHFAAPETASKPPPVRAKAPGNDLLQRLVAQLVTQMRHVGIERLTVTQNGNVHAEMLERRVWRVDGI